MSSQLTPALLIPYDAAGEELDDSNAITLDFNPETLTLKVQAGEEADRGRAGRQQSQHVAKSTATLSFDAIFDTTRPNPARGGSGDEPASPEKLDVRVKTSVIAGFLQAEGDGENSSPRRVRFHWGNVIFDGLIKSFSETLDYFSPEGVPLRSKLSLSITEQDFRYNVDADQVQRTPATPNANQAGDLAANNDLDSLFDLSAGAGFKLDLSLDLNLQVGLSLDIGFDADIKLGAELGFNADFDIGINAGVDFDISAGAALDLFGPAAIESSLGVGTDVDLGVALGGKALQSVTSPVVPGDAARPPSAWASEGPEPGSRASKLAVQVQQSRARSASTSRDRLQTRSGDSASTSNEIAQGNVVTPLPIRGSPPTRPASFGSAQTRGLFPTRQQALPLGTSDQSGRPTWEILPAESKEQSVQVVSVHQCCVPQRKPYGSY
ncbi:MAG: hypothetical protein KZQ96_03190 [Candidatus Thiodiazotropha sp. (ex Lucinoma borealis)]|nr:hypothetical protein [Candidatus Thiodiazotropha sp. (ex Lucinoma borealis)]